MFGTISGLLDWNDLGLVSFVVCLALLIAYPPFLSPSSLSFMKYPQFSKSHTLYTCLHTSRKAAPTTALESKFWLVPINQGDPVSLTGDWLRDDCVIQLCSMRRMLRVSENIPLIPRK